MEKKSRLRNVQRNRGETILMENRGEGTQETISRNERETQRELGKEKGIEAEHMLTERKIEE